MLQTGSEEMFLSAESSLSTEEMYDLLRIPASSRQLNSSSLACSKADSSCFSRVLHYSLYPLSQDLGPLSEDDVIRIRTERFPLLFRSDEDDWTPFTWCCSEDSVTCTRLLIDKADSLVSLVANGESKIPPMFIDERNRCWISPLHFYLCRKDSSASRLFCLHLLYPFFLLLLFYCSIPFNH